MEPKMAAGIWTETNPKLRAMNLPVSDCKNADARDRLWLNQIAAGDVQAFGLFILFEWPARTWHLLCPVPTWKVRPVNTFLPIRLWLAGWRGSRTRPCE